MCDKDARLKKSCLYVDMQVDDFVDFMFMKNTNSVIDLSLEGIENNKDLLCFFIDTMCKGLVMLFGKDNRLELDDISLDDFDIIRKKMALAGIYITLSVDSNINNIPPHVNIRELDSYPNDIELNDFIFKVTTIDYIYSITFEISKIS
jgi:hypothetical protein